MKKATVEVHMQRGALGHIPASTERVSVEGDAIGPFVIHTMPAGTEGPGYAEEWGEWRVTHTGTGYMAGGADSRTAAIKIARALVTYAKKHGLSWEFTNPGTVGRWSKPHRKAIGLLVTASR